ncbi:glycosyltransferase family 4 protein [Dietzia maris]|nr:glycosyltransferase family 4 protein [Dietzia maris]
MLQAKYPPAPTALTFSYSGVNLSGLSAQECVTSQNGPDSQYIIAVGSQDQNYKGHDLLIQCMPKLLADFPQTSLVLVGDGRLQSDLRNLADSLSVTDRVHFYGFVSSRQQLATIISNAEVFAMPSRAEGLPRALIEAMSLGVASIGSRVGGISELLSDDVLFESESSEALYSKLKGLLADGPARRRIGLEQKTFITKYLIDNSPSYRAELKLATRITLGLDAFEGKSVLPEDCELLGPKFRVLLVADGASKAVQIFACALVQALSRELPSVQIVLPPTATLSRKRLVGSDSFDMRKTLKRLCVVQIAEDGSGPIDLVLAPAAPARAARAINSVMANVTTLIAADDEAELPVGSRNVILMPYLDPSKWVSTTRQVLLTPAAPHTAFEMRGGIGSGRLLVPNRLVRGAQMFVRRFGSCQQ